MTADQWAAVAGAGTAASALFAFLAWRVANFQALASLPYLDVELFRRAAILRMAGQNADHWEIRSARIVWPLGARIVVNDPVYDDGGSIIEPRMKRIGRSTRKLDQGIFSSADSTVWLFWISLKYSPCQRYVRIVRTKKNV